MDAGLVQSDVEDRPRDRQGRFQHAALLGCQLVGDSDQVRYREASAPRFALSVCSRIGSGRVLSRR